MNAAWHLDIRLHNCMNWDHNFFFYDWLSSPSYNVSHLLMKMFLLCWWHDEIVHQCVQHSGRRLSSRGGRESRPHHHNVTLQSQRHRSLHRPKWHPQVSKLYYHRHSYQGLTLSFFSSRAVLLAWQTNFLVQNRKCRSIKKINKNQQVWTIISYYTFLHT